MYQAGRLLREVVRVTVDAIDFSLLACARNTIADFEHHIPEPTLQNPWAQQVVLGNDYPAEPGWLGNPLVMRSDHAVGTGNAASDDIHLREVVICCRASVARTFGSVLECSRPPAEDRRQVTS